jgi:hypothetical protein
VLFNKDKTTLVAYPGGKQGAYTIPNSVTSIGKRAFYGCKFLTSVTIPNSVTSIGYEAFSECWSITSIIFEGTIKEWGNIDKGVDWNRNVPATYVQCSDGQAPL